VSRPIPGNANATHADLAYWMTLARDPGADQGELRKLASVRATTNRRIVESLASNPATPPEMLLDLMEDAAPAFCRNPVAPLLTLEMPDFMEQASELGIARMLRSERAPAALVHYVADDYKVHSYLRDAARHHVAYRDPIPDDAWGRELFRFLAGCVEAVDHSDQKYELAELVDLGGVPEWLTREKRLDPPPAPLTFGGYVASLTNDRHKEAVLRGRVSPPARIAGTTQERELQMYARIGATFAPKLPVDLTAWMTTHEEIARVVARNPETPADILRWLVKNGDVQVRRALLANPSATDEIRVAVGQTVYTRALYESRECLNVRAGRGYHWRRAFPWAFKRVIALQHAPEFVRRPLFRPYTQSPLWEDRLAAAFAINDRPSGKPMRPKHRVLLEMLARDGHTLVRAVASGRLRGEKFEF
jgi:hypothetical protein